MQTKLGNQHKYDHKVDKTSRDWNISTPAINQSRDAVCKQLHEVCLENQML